MMSINAQLSVDVRFQTRGDGVAVDQIDIPWFDNEEQHDDYLNDDGAPIVEDLQLAEVEVEVQEETPSYIYSPAGIYEVPKEFIYRDLDVPIKMDQVDWFRKRREYCAMSTATFVEDRLLTPSNIVCLADPDAIDAADDTGNQPMVFWFVRVALRLCCSDFDFGGSFLWQLPHCASMSITESLARCEKELAGSEGQGTLLLGDQACSFVDFNPERWPTFKKATKMDNDFDIIFAMACAPCEKPLRSLKEASTTRKEMLDRPLSLQPAPKRMCFDAAAMPDDVMTLIIRVAADQFVKSPHQDDLEALLNMRLVSRGWRDLTEAVVIDNYNQTRCLIVRGTESGDVCDILKARDDALHKGLSVSAIVEDFTQEVERTVACYVRARTGKALGPFARVSCR